MIFGGSFDPPHNAHLEVVRRLLQAVDPDRLLLVPAGQSPSKDPSARSLHDRRALVEALVVAVGDDRVTPSWIEFEREGPSYTVDTLKALAARYPSASWSLAVGTDQLADFGQWREPGRILELARLVHVGRAGYEPPDTPWPTSAVVEGPAEPLSSTHIRERLAAGDDVAGFVPEAVLHVIEDRGLYSARG